MIDYTQALISLYKNCHWEQHGSEYSGLVWKDTNTPKPTQEELIAEYNRLQSEYEFKEYQRLREKKYPSIQEQLDALYHDIKAGNLETGTWIASIEAVKENYPKPE